MAAAGVVAGGFLIGGALVIGGVWFWNWVIGD